MYAPPFVSRYAEKREGASLFLVVIYFLLCTFGTIAVGSRFVSTDVQGHPRLFDEPPGTNRAGSEPGYFHLKERGLSAEVPNLISEEVVEYGDADTLHIVTQEDQQKTTQMDSSDRGRERRHVNLVIAVPSVRPDRRDAIRKTWLKWGDDRVVLRFFTEPPNEADHDNHEEISALLAEESLTHGDIIIQDIGTGMNFGVKLLEAMRWMSHHYSFDFFLRLDDDYFLCLERMLKELSCLIDSGTQQSPFYAGSMSCGEVPFIDEAYILVSSVIIDRILAESELNCTGFGSLTAAAWVRIGGPGNPQGDVAWVRDNRLDYMGRWWKQNQTSPACEENLGIHNTYPDQMLEYWEEISSKTNVSQSTAEGCEDTFRYEDIGSKCAALSRGVDDELLIERLEKDNLQPCGSFMASRSHMWCGKQGC